jgi:uncharacterized protein (TIGR04222 family)
MSSVLLQVIPAAVGAAGRAPWAQVPVTDPVHPSSTSPAPAAVGDTWGISGPDFVRIFAVLLVLTAVVAWIVRWRNDRRRDPAVRTADDLTPAELAYVANGPELVAVTVLWQLWREGALSVENSLIAALDASSPRGLDPRVLRSPAFAEASLATAVSIGVIPRDAADGVERDVLDAVVAAGALRPAELSRSVRAGEGMRALQARLEGRGLLRPPAVRRRMRRGVALVFTPLLVLGIVRLLVGLSRSKPVANLEALLVLAVVLLVGELLVSYRPRATVRLARRAHATMLRSASRVRESLAAPTPLLDEARALAALGAAVLWRANAVAAATLAVPFEMVVAGRRVTPGPQTKSGAWFFVAGGAAGGSSGGGGACGGGFGGGGGGCGGGGGGGGGGGCGGGGGGCGGGGCGG